MSLRPRYSLLAFLLFTAAIASGVKLWRGPHHVVDRSNPQLEDEYTYYLDWDGTKVMEGVRVLRYGKKGDHFSVIYFYRHGDLIGNPKPIADKHSRDTRDPSITLEMDYPQLSKQELNILARAIDSEKRSIHED
jgi:hypothetical protein